MIILKTILLFVLLLCKTAELADSPCDSVTPLREEDVCGEDQERVCYEARGPQELSVSIAFTSLCESSLCPVSQLNPVLVRRGDSISLSFSGEPFFRLPSGLSVYLFPGEQSFITCDSATNYDQLIDQQNQEPNATLFTSSLLDGVNYLSFSTDISCVYLRMVVNVQVVDCVSPDSESTVCSDVGVCAASTDLFSGAGYSCVCPEGVNYRDNYCGDVSECSPDPCQNGGSCVEGYECGFTCNCREGYTGTLCEDEIVYPCASAPCANGSDCISENGEYKCVCPPGVTGQTCDEKVNNCIPYPCLNQAACLNVSDGYECICREGYTGRNCSGLIFYCNHTLCMSGECINLVGGYMCVCPPAGRADSTCGCYAGLCQNNGVCSDEIGYAVCNCPIGYSGDICEMDLGLCERQNPCSNFGICQVSADGNISCICEPTHTGVNCSTPVNPCFDVTCNSRGTCIPQSDSYLCECVAGYSGIHCETPDPCSTNPCFNTSTCVNATNPETGDEFQCVCPSGMTGRTCNETCESLPYNNGTCMTDPDTGVVRCICPFGRGGPCCDVDIDIVTPLFQGDSYLEFQSPSLTAHSELRIRFRASLPNGVILFSSLDPVDVGDYILVQIYEGLVSVRFDCGSGEESTRISEQRLDDNIYHILDISISSCRVELSVNSWHSSAVSAPAPSTVIDLRSGLYIGGVPDDVNLPAGANRVGLYGCVSSVEIGESAVPLDNPIQGRHIDNCEENVCQNVYCSNGGRCVDSGAGYSCICPDGSEADSCGLPACLKNPCMHGGDCLLQGGQAVCVCQPFFTGPLCEEKAVIQTPFFSGSQHSFIRHGLSNLELVSLSLTVKPNASFTSGVLVYTSQREDGLGDYLMLALSGGYPVVQWDLGSGQGLLSSSTLLLADVWYQIQVTRSGRSMSISVDGSPTVSAASSGIFQVLDTGRFLYLGGVASLSFISPLAAALGINGYTGCVEEFEALSRSDLSVLSNAGGSESGSGVLVCDTRPCVPNVCQNGAECVNIMGGLSCVCVPGYTGTYCSSLLERDECVTQECAADATCVILSSGPRCLCPLGKTGDRCQQNILITYPSFTKSPFAYLQYSIEDTTLYTNIALEFYTQSRYGLILFTSQNTGRAAGDFLSLAVFDGHLELRWNLGSGAGLLQWPEPLALSQWYRAEVIRTARLSQLSVSLLTSEATVSAISGNSPGTLSSLNSNGAVYVGGADSYVRTAASSGVATGLNGCVRGLVINGRTYSHSEATAGVDVESCSPHPCVSHSCGSGSTCKPSADFTNYSCACHIPLTGEMCDVMINFENASFSGDSYAVYPYTSNPVTIEISLRFRTMDTEGVIAWIGEERGDHLSIGLRGGQVHGSIDLGSGVTSWIFSEDVSDESWHNISVRYEDNQLRTTLDDNIEDIMLTGQLENFNPTGGVWIGGHEDLEMTGFSSGLTGCVSQLVLSGTRIDLDNPSEVISSRNVISCDS